MSSIFNISHHNVYVLTQVAARPSVSDTKRKSVTDSPTRRQPVNQQARRPKPTGGRDFTMKRCIYQMIGFWIPVAAMTGSFGCCQRKAEECHRHETSVRVSECDMSTAMKKSTAKLSWGWFVVTEQGVVFSLWTMRANSLGMFRAYEHRWGSPKRWGQCWTKAAGQFVKMVHSKLCLYTICNLFEAKSAMDFSLNTIRFLVDWDLQRLTHCFQKCRFS